MLPMLLNWEDFGNSATKVKKKPKLHYSCHWLKVAVYHHLPNRKLFPPAHTNFVAIYKNHMGKTHMKSYGKNTYEI
jgi:hypothetical protein